MIPLFGQLQAGKQWGVADNGVAAQNWSKTITLPIAFSNPNYIVAGSATIIDGIYVLFTHSNKTTSSVLILVSGCWDGNTSRYANWFALGYQQWGYVSHNNVRSDTPKVAVFPISFTKTIYTISTQLHMTNVRPDVGTGPYIVSYSNNQMSILFNIEHSGVIMDGAWWLVIGK